MAKKTVVVKNTKTKKKTATTGEKPVVKTAQTKSAVTRKPADTAKLGTQNKIIKKPQDEGSNYFVYGGSCWIQAMRCEVGEAPTVSWRR